MIQGLNHITFSVSNLSDSIKFYVDILGGILKVKWSQGAYIELGHLWLALNVDKNAGGNQNDDINHIAFTVTDEDYNHLCIRLKDNGVLAYKDNRSEGKSFYFRDPDGHNLEIHVGDLNSRIEAIKGNPNLEYEIY